MKKLLVIDTNVIFSHSNFLSVLSEHNIIITLPVLEEVDKYKQGHTQLAKNARAFVRKLEELRGKGSLLNGVKLTSSSKSGSLFVVPEQDLKSLPTNYDVTKNDNQILATCLFLKKKNPILITNDVNLRVKADSVKIAAEPFKDTEGNEEKDEQYSGITSLTVSPVTIHQFLEEGHLEVKDKDLIHNQYVELVCSDDKEDKFIGRYSANKKSIISLSHDEKTSVWGIHPRNAEQLMALDALLDNNIKLVTLSGTAGTGKTLLTIAAALEQVTQSNSFSKLLISRSVTSVGGQDIGFLPGTLEEKMAPWMQGIYDNLEALMMGNSSSKKKKGKSNTVSMSHNELIEQGMVEVEALAFIRGRSIPNVFFLIDEAQNLTKEEIKTIITRAGEGTKIVLIGDTDQIDAKNLDSENNGLSYVTEKFKGQKIYAHVTLKQGERSELATLGAELL